MTPAQEHLVLTHAPLVTLIAARFRRELSIDEFEDITQEGLLALSQAAARFDAEILAPELFLRFARNRLHKAIRAAVATIRRDRCDVTNVDESAFREREPMLTNDARDDVHDAVARLSPFEAWVVRERYGLETGVERSIADLCRDCGLGYRLVAAVLEAARKRLSRQLIRHSRHDPIMRTRFSATA